MFPKDKITDDDFIIKKLKWKKNLCMYVYIFNKKY